MSKSVEEKLKRTKEKLLESKIGVPTFSECKKYQRVWYEYKNSMDGILYAKITTEAELKMLDTIHDILKKRCTRNHRILWSNLKEIFEIIEREYSTFNNEDTSVRSAPDTSRYIANKAGWLKFDQKFSVTEGYCQFQRYFHYGIKIGGNFKFGRPHIVIEYILKAIDKYYGLPVYSDGKEPVIRDTSGTNWSAIGIG